MRVGDDETGIVCYVTPQGDVVCEPVLESLTPQMARVVNASDGLSEKSGTALESVLPQGTWGPNKIKLALRILEVLAKSDLPDEPNIPRRSGEIVDSVRQLLEPVPPSILLYNYSTQPANVMGAYYLNRGDLVQMQQMFKTFEHPKTP